MTCYGNSVNLLTDKCQSRFQNLVAGSFPVVPAALSLPLADPQIGEGANAIKAKVAA